MSRNCLILIKINPCPISVLNFCLSQSQRFPLTYSKSFILLAFIFKVFLFQIIFCVQSEVRAGIHFFPYYPGQSDEEICFTFENRNLFHQSKAYVRKTS